MELNDLIKQELWRGFTKSELERIWDLPKNSLSAVLNVDNAAKLSKKGEVRVRAYFNSDPINRPDPSPRIARNMKVVGTVPLPKDYVSFDNVGALNEDGSITSLDISAMDGLYLGKTKEELVNEIMKFGTATTKTEIVDGKVKLSVVDKKQIVSDKMPEGLDWRQKLEWKRNNKK